MPLLCRKEVPDERCDDDLAEMATAGTVHPAKVPFLHERRIQGG